jgi:hypothetical protein
MLIPQNYTIKGSIPQQLGNSSTNTFSVTVYLAMIKGIKAVFSVMDTSLASGIVANIVIAVALGASMKRMWSLLNSLQIITHLILLAIVLPSNLQVCLETVI